MNTENLITALAADLPNRPTSIPRALSLALLASIPIAAAALLFGLQLRSDFWQVVSTPRFEFKFVFTLAMCGAGLWLVARLSRPGVTAGPARLALGAALAILLVAVGIELTALPANTWLPTLVGTMAVPCVVLIPLLSAAPLAALLIAMKAGAPDSPAVAGAAVGLLAGAIGATFYAPHCTNDSPLFVAVWYVIGIAAVALAGSLIGSRVLRW